MNHVLSGWAAYERERREHKATTEAYDAAILQLQRALNELAKPCPMCDEMERERNNALLDIDNLQADVHHLEQSLRFAERMGFGPVRADGDAP